MLTVHQRACLVGLLVRRVRSLASRIHVTAVAGIVRRLVETAPPTPGTSLSPFRATRDDIVAFRLHRHGLDRRVPTIEPGLVFPLGLQDTAAGGVAQMLAVRADAVDADTVPRLVAEGMVTPTWGPRLAATLVAPEHEELVAAALLDPDPPAATPQSFAGLADALARAALPVLRKQGPLTKAELGEALLSQTPPHARFDCARCGRVHPHDELVKMLVWTNRIRLDPGDRHGDRVAPAARWRPRRFRRIRDDQRAELVRRFLRLHGPATADDLAAWAGIDPSYAARSWRLVTDELVAVDAPHGAGWMLAADRGLLDDPPPPPAARLVPAYDPLLGTRNRDSLVAGRDRQQAIWRATANPGVVVAGPEVIGTWRGRTRGRRYEVTVTPFEPRPAILDAVEADAHTIATARGCDAVSLASN